MRVKIINAVLRVTTDFPLEDSGIYRSPLYEIYTTVKRIVIYIFHPYFKKNPLNTFTYIKRGVSIKNWIIKYFFFSTVRFLRIKIGTHLEVTLKRKSSGHGASGISSTGPRLRTHVNYSRISLGLGSVCLDRCFGGKQINSPDNIETLVLGPDKINTDLLKNHRRTTCIILCKWQRQNY